MRNQATTTTLMILILALAGCGGSEDATSRADSSIARAASRSILDAIKKLDDPGDRESEVTGTAEPLTLVPTRPDAIIDATEKLATTHTGTTGHVVAVTPLPEFQDECRKRSAPQAPDTTAGCIPEVRTAECGLALSRTRNGNLTRI